MLRQRIMQAADAMTRGDVPRTQKEALAQYVSVDCMLVVGHGASESPLLVVYHMLIDMLPHSRLSLSPQCGFSSHSKVTFVSYEVSGHIMTS